MSDPFDELFRELTGRRRRAGGARHDPPHEPGRDEPGSDEPDGDGGEGNRARPVTPGPRRRRPGGLALVVAVVVVVLLVLILGGTVVTFWTDSIWYSSVGFSGVFWTRFWAQVLLFFGAGLVAGAFLFLNLWIAARNSPPPDPTRARSISGFFRRLGESSRYGGEGMLGEMFGRPRPVVVDADEEELPDLTPIATWILIAIVALVTLTVAASAAGGWQTILLWLHRVPFDPSGKTVPDPIFGLDLSFFLFDLPFLRYLQEAANGLLLITLLIVGARYGVGALRGTVALTRAARIHLAVLGALFLLSVAAGYQLDRLGLVYSNRGVATGVAAADSAVSMTAFEIMTLLAIVVAAVVLASAWLRRIWPLAASIGIWIIAQVVLVGILPNVVESLQVKPNEFAQEQPFITNNINMTRLAYGLTSWTDQPYSGTGTLTQADITADATTFENARLWDYRPLGTTLDQLQTVRQYYDFFDVDTDRYSFAGTPRQVMLSAREIAPEKNPQAQSWVNLHITYTHGFGLAMVPVNQVTTEGLPDLVIQNMPPVSSGGAPTITEPRIYFGERPNDYVIVDARQPEFDYPLGSSQGADQTTTSWSGTTGISLASPLTKLLFSLRLGDLNLLISDQLTDQSKLLFNRTLGERLGLIAPYLRYDKDPYLVVTGDGKLAYVQDAYTTSDMFPNAQAIDTGALPGNSGLATGPLDYVRNSVKIVQNAYDGTLTFYVADSADPIIRAWEGIFPDVYRPMSQMPADIRAHLRQPEDLFDAQARIYATYHVTDPQTFYTGNDLWTVPQENASGASQRLPLEAYYVEMRMPSAASSEFLLLQPMVPKSRPNMIAWIAARNDGDNYGQVVVYHFPRDTTIFGPTQIEARIDQDPTISAQITLWNQSGSSVQWGNLIVVPIQDSLLYLEPVYLQSTGSAFPEFQKIVVASPTKVVWANTLADALNQLIAANGPGASPSPSPSLGPGGSPAPTASAPPTASPTPLPSGLPEDVKALVDYASAHYDAAQRALKNGDFATYGAEMAQVKAALDRLSLLVGASPSPSVSASPAP